MNLIHFVLLAVKLPVNPLGWADGFIIFTYLGPETIMPLASILATIVGAILIFWRFIVGAIKRLIRFILRKPASSPASEDPVALAESDSDQSNVG